MNPYLTARFSMITTDRIKNMKLKVLKKEKLKRITLS
jgi:hypothetical protein